MLLANRVAVVTGAAGLIGKGLASHLHDEGAAIAAVDRPGKDMGEEVARMASAGAPAAAFECDVTDPTSVAKLVEDVEASMGQVDLLVNCHGLSNNHAIVDITPEQWDGVFAINARGTMLLCQAYARQWMKRGVRGSIVNISSGAATSARAGNAHYAGSKAAVDMLTQTLAIELGPHGIRVNAVSPSVVLDRVITEERDDEPEYINMMWRATPLRRTGEPIDVARAVAFLASDNASWVTGVVLPVSGGSHCGRTHVPLTPIEQILRR
jgi:3-oxoacyl-[acyl-carrier protein] reductase